MIALRPSGCFGFDAPRSERRSEFREFSDSIHIRRTSPPPFELLRIGAFALERSHCSPLRSRVVIDSIGEFRRRINCVHQLVFIFGSRYIPSRTQGYRHGWPDRPLHRTAENPHSRVSTRPYRARAQARVPPVWVRRTRVLWSGRDCVPSSLPH